MAPLAEKYTLKTKLREITCSGCKKIIGSRMVIPRCGSCGTYNE